MLTLRIEHPVTDFDTWMAAFDRFADLRHQSGVLHQRIQRPIDDPRYVVIDLEFATTAEAETFLQILQTKIWSTPERSPALAGTPQTRILAPARLTANAS